ncbi:MAG: PorV/PorQ family protein [Candidatus Margulisbacteria bacterium]|nr:PorV/PorQ family protein [Candidatus Margulisiibacteriota bacterium]
MTNDPTHISVGARVLGMGKAFVGTADDLNSIFINPAGLSRLDSYQLTSMSGKFVNEINYLDLGAAYPFGGGTVALGYVGSGVGFISPTGTTETIDGTRIIPSTTEGVNYDYNDNVLLLSYGANFLKELSGGATLKIFSQSLVGPNISGGTASGYDIDLGLLYSPNPTYRLGATLQNALPVSLGGKITWGSGAVETIPCTLKLGSSVKILGENGLTTYQGHELSADLDYDIAPTRPNIPNLFHLGFQWFPADTLDLRCGIDQDTVGRSGGLYDVANNLTAGVGFLFNGFRFDYAFHQYYSIPENDTHYFSLTYGVWRKKPAPQEKIQILSPADKTIAYADKIKFSGRLLDRDIKKISINNVNAPIIKGSFEAEVPLSERKNGFTVTGFNGEGKPLEKKKIRVLKLKTFADLTANYWAKLPVEQLATENIIAGYPDGMFKPEGGITRAEFLTLLVRVKGVPLSPVAKPPFKDLLISHWAAQYIQAGMTLKLVVGYPDGTFQPQNGITRAEGVAVAARFGELDLARAGDEVYFKDIPGRHWALKEINAARAAGFISFLENRPFEPNRALSRGETAEILSHTKFIAQKIADLMDWEKGYY